LHLELHFAEDLAQGTHLQRLQTVLAATSPRLFASLEVHAYERDRDRIALEPTTPTALRDAVIARGTSRGETYDALVADDPNPPSGQRRFGSVLLCGRGRGATGRYLSVRFDTEVPAMRIGRAWLWSNSIGASVSVPAVEGLARAAWLEELAIRLASEATFLWGAAYVHGEFTASNLDTSHGARAIGRDVRRHLPGVYWLNLFGQPYVDLIGTNVQSLHGIAAVRDVGDAILIKAYEAPEDWQGQEHHRRALAAAIGQDLFFDRAHPDRPTRAPDFGLAEIHNEREPLQVITSDGIHFTPMPRFDE
jgi:hypothetical protein